MADRLPLHVTNLEQRAGRGWVGVDPGANETGIIGRHGSEVTYRTVVVRPTGDRGTPVPGRSYTDAVAEATLEAWQATRRRAGAVTVAAEGLLSVAPANRRGRRDPAAAVPIGSQLATAVVLGVLLGPDAWPDLVLVPAGAGYGQHPLRVYPPQLVGGRHNPPYTHPEESGTGMLRHCRSAWDVSYAARGRLRRGRVAP